MMLQRTDEWYAARLGKVTASRISDVMAKTKSGYSASRANYMAELLCERLTGIHSDHYVSAEMARGTEIEPQARSSFEFIHDVQIVECGFIPHPAIADFGASPDGLIGDNGLIEIKCPNTATHIDYLLNGTIPQRYVLQMQVQMMCARRAWCDFVSFDPRLPDHLQWFVKRVRADAGLQAEIEVEVRSFLGTLAEKETALRSLEMAA